MVVFRLLKAGVVSVAGLLMVATGCGRQPEQVSASSPLSATDEMALTLTACAPKAVYGKIGEKYARLGGSTGFLGCPLTDELDTPNKQGRYNHFQNGSIYFKWGASEAFVVYGAIRNKWAAMGYENGLGFPITDEIATPGNAGRFNHFERGSIYFKWGAPAAYAVYGKIRDKWAQLGWERGLGFPITDEQDLPGRVGRFSDFQRGRIIFRWGASEAEVVQQPGAGDLNSRVIAYAQSKMGQQVDSGECWDLANEALRAAGAHQPGTNGYGTYVFGAVVGSPAPGDIIQFENVRFVYSNHYQDFPHHTAIVESVNGTTLGLINQNVDNNRTVSRTVIDLAAKQSGTLTIFAPQPR